MYPAFKVNLNDVPVYRLIHQEFEGHYISAAQLFKACGLTITEGFFVFNLKSTDFEVDFLIAQFPFCDIWVSVDQARAMALTLGVDEELALLLSDSLDDCYSLDNINRSEIMHNWMIPSIPNLQYSTRALLETWFDTVRLLIPPSRKIRTQISRSRQPGIVMKDRTEAGIVRWQVWAYEQFLQHQGEETQDLPLLDRSGAIWDVMQGTLCDLQTLNRTGQATTGSRVLSDNMLVGNMPLKKEYLGQSLFLQQLYIGVMSEKIINEIEHLSLLDKHNNSSNNNKNDVINSNPTNVEEILPPDVVLTDNKNNNITVTTPSSSSLIEAVQADTNMLFHDRLDLLEQELYRIKKKSKKRIDEMELQQEELIQQITLLNNWKSQFEKSRKSERVWMFLVMVSVLFGIVSIRHLYGL
jgi:hypothetical protein